jgi:hypothetical protein
VSRRYAAAAGALCVALVVGGVALATRPDGDGDRDDALVTTLVDPVPATDESLIALVLEHIDPEPNDFEELYREDGGAPADALGGELRFNAGDGDDGDLLAVMVTRLGTRDEEICRPGKDDRCEVIGTDGGDVVLSWDLESPGEDPGIVIVTVERDGTRLHVYQAGPTITDDPRDLDLPIDVDDMVEILNDPRLGTETSRALVETEVPGWPGAN